MVYPQITRMFNEYIKVMHNIIQYTHNLYNKAHNIRKMVRKMGIVRMSITLPKDTKEKLERIAKGELRSVSNMIAYLVETYEGK